MTLPGGEKRRRLQARLLGKPDRSDRGELRDRTAAALSLPVPHAELVAAFLEERVLLVAGEPVGTSEGATLVFTSAFALAQWDSSARPVQTSGQEAAMMAIAIGAPRFLVDQRILLTRPAVEALAAGDTWVAPWDDPELRDELGANVRVVPATHPLVLEVRGDSQSVGETIARISASQRLRAAAEAVEIRPLAL